VNVPYRVLYRLGITPWDREDVPERVRLLLEESPHPGRALDVGCGTGRDSVYLARHGWAVTAIDGVPQALDAARRRAEAAGVEVKFVQGDVTALHTLGVGEGYDFVLDRGCFHGLGDDARESCAQGVTAVAAPGAGLLMFAFAPGRRGPAPRGISAEELMRYFGRGWELISSEPDTEVQLARWLGNAEPTWHRLKRRG
jgi:SAM-dependent methyltransferase